MRPLALASALPLACCSYSMTGFFPGNLKATHVAVFTNSSDRSELERLATETFLERLAEDGRLDAVSAERAKLVVTGAITSYRRSPETFDDAGRILTYRVTITSRIGFDYADGDSAYLAPATYTGWALYDAERGTEEEGIKAALSDLSDQALRALFMVD